MSKKRYLFSDIESTKFIDKDKLVDFKSTEYNLEFKLGSILEYNTKKDELIDKKSFFDFEKYANYLCSDLSRYKRKIVYFHNLGFDSKFLIDYLNKRFDKIKIIKSGSQILSIKCFRTRIKYVNSKRKVQNDCLLQLKDSLAILLISIKKLGNIVGFNKLDFEFNYSGKENRKKAIKYCEQDCRIIYLSLKHFIKYLKQFFKKFGNKIKADKPETINFDFLPLTIASLSKKIIKMFYPKVFYRIDQYLEPKIRKYYFGGRTEVFNFNEIFNGIYLDVHSLYPSVMAKYNFANGKVYRIKTKRNEINWESNVLAYECQIKENQNYPLYPNRLRNRVMFYNGKKNVIITKPEYNHLKKLGYLGNKVIIQKVNWKYVQIDNPITFNLMNLLYDYRYSFDSNHPYYYITKILMNSGYGKFGEHPEKEQFTYLSKINSMKDIKEKRITEVNGKLFERKMVYQYYLTNNLFNAILITSYARFELWKMIDLCNRKGIDVYYCDTDSVVIEKNNLNQLSEYIGSKLGDWAIEKSFDKFQAIDVKEYFTEDIDGNFKSKYKGVRNEHLDSFKKLKEHLKKGTRTQIIGSFFYCQNRKSDNRAIHIIDKHKRSYYYKRKINKDLSTKPLNKTDNLKIVEFKNKLLIKKQLGLNYQDDLTDYIDSNPIESK